MRLFGRLSLCTSNTHRSIRRLTFEAIEPRLLLHGGTPFDGPAYPLEIDELIPPTALNPVFLLSSNPGAPATLYLDFNGHTEPSWREFADVETPPFDLDGNPDVFSIQELDAIHEIWARVAEDFAPFNINVTTVDPGDFSDGVALRVAIGGSNTDWWGQDHGGVAPSVGAFTNSDANAVYVFSATLFDNARETARAELERSGLDAGDAAINAVALRHIPAWVADTASHEAGHAFGLQHQRDFSPTGRLLEEYYSPDTPPGPLATSPLMGDHFSAPRTVWWRGEVEPPLIVDWGWNFQNDQPAGQPTLTANFFSSIQDDMAVIASEANGFGYRPDDHGDNPAHASPLAPSRSRSALGLAAFEAAGIVEQTTDTDSFSFSTTGGRLHARLAGIRLGTNLDARLELRAADGTLIAWDDPDNSLLATIDMDHLSAGTYYLVAASHGSYGDVGQYTLFAAVTFDPVVPYLLAPTDFSRPAAAAETRSHDLIPTPDPLPLYRLDAVPLPAKTIGLTNTRDPMSAAAVDHILASDDSDSLSLKLPLPNTTTSALSAALRTILNPFPLLAADAAPQPNQRAV